MLSSPGDFTGALDAWHTALSLMEAYGNRHQQTGILSNVAYYHCLLGQFDHAEPLVRRALELAQAFDRQSEYAYTLNVQGTIHQARGEWEAALSLVCHIHLLYLGQVWLCQAYPSPAPVASWFSTLCSAFSCSRSRAISAARLSRPCLGGAASSSGSAKGSRS